MIKTEFTKLLALKEINAKIDLINTLYHCDLKNDIHYFVRDFTKNENDFKTAKQFDDAMVDLTSFFHSKMNDLFNDFFSEIEENE